MSASKLKLACPLRGLLFFGVTLCVGVTHAQLVQDGSGRSETNEKQCAALGTYRNSDLLQEWVKVEVDLRKGQIRFDGLIEQRDTLQQGKSDLSFHSIWGNLAHVAQIGANITENTISIVVPYADYKSHAFDAIKAYRNYKKNAESSAFDVTSDTAIKDAASLVLSKLSAINKSYKAIHALASDVQRMTHSMAVSSDIDRQLTAHINTIRKNIAEVEPSIARLRSNFTALQGVKDEIDKACGGVFGCPVPGSALVSRPGSTKCLVNVNSVICPGCKSGWRHRCTANGRTGMESDWTPVEECLANELKTAKAGLSSQQTAAATFSAQANSFANIPSDEERERRRRDSDAKAAGYANAMRRGAADAAMRNAVIDRNSQDGNLTGDGIGGADYNFYCVDPELYAPDHPKCDR